MVKRIGTGGRSRPPVLIDTVLVTECLFKLGRTAPTRRTTRPPRPPGPQPQDRPDWAEAGQAEHQPARPGGQDDPAAQLVEMVLLVGPSQAWQNRPMELAESRASEAGGSRRPMSPE